MPHAPRQVENNSRPLRQEPSSARRGAVPLLVLGLVLVFSSGSTRAWAGSENPPPTDSKAPLSSDVCEQRRPLSMDQSQAVLMFRANLMHVDALRAGPDARGVTYSAKLAQILQSADVDPTLQSDQVKDKAREFLMYEEFKQALFEEGLLTSKEFENFDRSAQSILLFSAVSYGELSRAVVPLDTLITNSIAKKDFLASVSGTSAGAESGAGATQDPVAELRAASRRERILVLFELVKQSLAHDLYINNEHLDDQMAKYRQFFFTGLGVGAIAGTSVFAGAVATGAGATFAASGTLLAGCGLGAIGRGAESLLRHQYTIYTSALEQSQIHKTAFSCELRRSLNSENLETSLAHSTLSAALGGAAVGCTMSAAGLFAPKVVSYTVIGAVSIAAATQGVKSAADVYRAASSYHIYLSMMNFHGAELAMSAGDQAKARQYLDRSREYAKKAGSHALSAVFDAVALRSLHGELPTALASGKSELLALIAKSADDSASALAQFNTRN
jgi:hypothetical protein